MEEAKKPENHMTSAAAFVEGGIQDAYDEACSICLEEFCESDPSTVTTCKHEFHLQCILEWCQRSSQCPMCLQPISLKDSTSQELLEAVEQERDSRTAPSRNTAIFHHPALGNFELQHLPLSADDAELEERILQHLAAAAMGRAHHMGRRGRQRSRSSAHGRPQFLVVSSRPSGTHSGLVSTSGGDDEHSSPAISSGDEPETQNQRLHSVQTNQVSFPESGSSFNAVNNQGASSNIRSAGFSPPPNEDRPGPSEFQSFSESLKSRLSSVSMRYKESISKSTRGWKEKLFARRPSISELGSEIQREVNAGIATVSRMMERLETRENSVANQGSTVTEQSNGEIRGENRSSNTNAQAARVANSATR